MANVIVATGQPVELQALCAIVREAGHNVAGQTQTGQSIMQLLRTTKPDLLIVSTTLPGMDGFEVLRHIKARALSTRVILFGAETASHWVERFYQAGAHGFVGNQEDAAELRRAIAGVLSGHRYFPNFEPSNDARDGANPLSALSERELTILRYLVRGTSNVDIAAELNISEKTVSTHRANLRKKLNARTLVDLVETARTHGLIKESSGSAIGTSELFEASDTDVALLRAMLDGTPLPLHVRDREGRLVAGNEAFLSMHNTTLEKVIGTRITDVDWLPAQTAQDFQQRYLQRMTAGKAVSADIETIRHGKRVVFHAWATPYHSPDGRLLGMVCGSIEVTDREDLLKVLAMERDNAAAVHAGMSRFLIAICEELETPAGLLREIVPQRQDERAGAASQTLAARASDAAQRLGRLIAGIRDLVGLEQGQRHLSFDRVSPDQLTRTVVEATQPQAASRGATLSFQMSGDATTPVTLDSHRYAQLVAMLIRFMLAQRPHAAVEVSLDVTASTADTQRLTVEIASLLPSGPDDTRHEELIVSAATDLGLLLCRRFAELMHGTLHAVESASGITRVVLRLFLPAG